MDELQTLQEILPQMHTLNAQTRGMWTSEVAATIILIWAIFWSRL
ncbi:hypothetical protein [Ruficoccus sp. ZRK36]|nr:hypothetical protein [Ruficoccus sp. ZRK36]